MRGQVLKGHLDMLLLAAIAAGTTHGYAIAERLRQASDGGFDLPDGTIYPALRRLEQRGFVKSSWESGSGGRARRHYRLTKSGSAALAEQTAAWALFERSVLSVLAQVPA